MNYDKFLESRKFTDIRAGFSVSDSEITSSLKEHQKYLVKWSLLKGRAAVFADTGLGKTRILSEWARLIQLETGGRIIILSPLAVAKQTIIEAAYVGVDLHYCRHDTGHNFIITNYEMIDNFNLDEFVGVILDESSILKNFDGKLRARLTLACCNIPYRLCCTATPSPNDYMELGTHSEFLGIMPRAEMLAMFFQHDSSLTSNWILKGHGRAKFWEWLSTWAVVIRTPSDLGLDGSEYELPELNIIYHEIPSNEPIASTLTERRIAKRNSLDIRVSMAALMANINDDHVLIWCHLNDESEQLRSAIPDAVEVRGSDSVDIKENRLLAFSNGVSRVLITKPSIAGFGMNWQHCNTIIFAGLTDSFEEFYQAVRRCYRFGQTKPVTVHCFLSTAESSVLNNLKRKERMHDELSRELMKYMTDHIVREVVGSYREYSDHNPNQEVQFYGMF